MSDLKVRWRLFADESEPTSRERGMRVYEELQRQGWDADKWDGAEVADVMGVSRATARVLLHRSRVAFRRAFRDVAPEGALPALGLAFGMVASS